MMCWKRVGLLFALMLGILLITGCIDMFMTPVYLDFDGELPVVGSQRNLEKLLTPPWYSRIKLGFRLGDEAPMGESEGLDHSQTNVQVDGVDEADIVKVHGEYIFQARGDQVSILRAYPVDSMALKETIRLETQGLTAGELYVDDQFLVVVAWSGGYYSRIGFDSNVVSSQRFVEPWYGEQTTVVLVYDISDMDEIHLVRRLELEGSYLSSRKIDNYLYVLSNRYIYQANKPWYADSVRGDDAVSLDYNEIRYFPGFTNSSYLLVAAVDLDGDEEAQVSAFVGAGRTIHMTRDNLYVAMTKEYDVSAVYRFTVQGLDISFAGRGVVAGEILNQFSMGEHDGFFHIATTTNRTMTSNVYVLDGDMEVIGSLTGIAPNERIYAARFSGDRAYLVTFEIIDPFFVIDLSEPRNPRVLGELKIPGFSTYLHPLDPEHVLGIGQDAKVMENGSWQWAVTTGMKLAIFNVEDETNPIEEHVLILGDSGTHSEALHNYRAIMIDLNRHLLALPMRIVETSGASFQGAVLFGIDPSEGLVIRGRVSHLEQNMYSWEHNIVRVIRIGHILYALSTARVSAHDLTTLEQLYSVEYSRWDAEEQRKID